MRKGWERVLPLTLSPEGDFTSSSFHSSSFEQAKALPTVLVILPMAKVSWKKIGLAFITSDRWNNNNIINNA